MKKHYFALLTIIFIANSIFAVPLAGVYTVGTGGDYTTLADARSALADGISAPVEFRILPGIYTEQVEFNFPVSGSSEENTITITSSTGNRDDVTIQYQPTINANYSYIISFASTSHFILRELTLYNYSAVYGIVVKLTICSDITIDNCRLKGLAGINNVDSKLIYAHAYQNESDVTISNNEFFDGYYGIEWLKNTSVIDSDNVIINNTFTNIGRGLINVKQQNNLQIINNYFCDTVTQYNVFGYQLVNCTNSKVQNNTVYMYYNTSVERTLYGIYLDENVCTSGTENIISNNFISIKSSNTLNNIFALYVNNYNNVNVYFNTASIISGKSASASVYFKNNAGVGESRVIDFRNNNIYANSNGKVLKLSAEIVAGNYFNSSDYNNYYQESSSATIFAYDITTINTIEEFVTANSSDYHSISEEPFFFGEFDLHLTGMWSTLTDKGIALANYLTDIDGKPRNLEFVEIGADELPDVNLEIVEILNPQPTCTSVVVNPEFEIKNNGPDTIMAGQVFLGKVYISSTLINEEYFTLSEDLLPEEERVFTFSEEFNFSIAGNYTFTFIAENSFDDNRIYPVEQLIPYYFKPTISFQSPPESVCYGSDAGLIMNFTGTSPFDVSYEYNGNQNNIIGHPDSELEESIQIFEETEFSVSIIDANGCLSDTTPLTISVLELPTAIYTGEISVCDGTALELVVELNTGETPWSFTATNGTEEFTVSDIITNEWANDTIFESPFTFTVLAYTDANGCITSTPFYQDLSLLQLPETLIPEDTTICNDAVIELHAGDGFLTYLWEGPNDFESTEENIIIDASILEPGENYFYISISNENCFSTDSVLVIVDICNQTEIEKAVKPEIFPNPATDFITLKNAEFTTAYIYSAGGKLVKEIKFNDGIDAISIDNLSPGLYLLKFANDGKEYNMKFIKE